MALLPGHLLCQRQKPTSIYMKTMTSTSKSANEFSALDIVSTVRQLLKLGAAVRVPGARTQRVRAPRPWCGTSVIS